MEILKVENLCKIYGKGNNQVQALNDVSFSVEKGEFVAIVGQSGSGKSTLLHLIGGVDNPTSGHIFVDGQDVYKKNKEQLAIFRRRQVGLIYQFYNLIPILNVVENMTLPLKLDGQKVNDERVNELLEVLGLADRKKHLPSQLSGGQKQRISIARVFLKNPKILILDEATSALDNESEYLVQQSLERLASGRTTITVAHRLTTIKNADKILVVTKDGIAESGNHEELVAQGGLYSTMYKMYRV